MSRVGRYSFDTMPHICAARVIDKGVSLHYELMQEIFELAAVNAGSCAAQLDLMVCSKRTHHWVSFVFYRRIVLDGLPKIKQFEYLVLQASSGYFAHRTRALFLTGVGRLSVAIGDLRVEKQEAKPFCQAMVHILTALSGIEYLDLGDVRFSYPTPLKQCIQAIFSLGSLQDLVISWSLLEAGIPTKIDDVPSAYPIFSSLTHLTIVEHAFSSDRQPIWRLERFEALTHLAMPVAVDSYGVNSPYSIQECYVAFRALQVLVARPLKTTYHGTPGSIVATSTTCLGWNGGFPVTKWPKLVVDPVPHPQEESTETAWQMRVARDEESIWKRAESVLVRRRMGFESSHNSKVSV
ncbi:hypothetical protein DL96DRAFT_1712142 [Flagelloscypha sp. PMI_526]|nr:hypothetical protein DL96DRAFT_1712142 [Flagelloscypha sp. PMI_526]